MNFVWLKDAWKDYMNLRYTDKKSSQLLGNKLPSLRLPCSSL